jgi:HPt (histidine-containing phosphotransfer) domain-containing protein
MRNLVEESNFDALTEKAHWLKGSAGSVGFDPFTAPAKRLEQASKEQNAAECKLQMQIILALQKRISVPSLQLPTPRRESIAETV